MAFRRMTVLQVLPSLDIGGAERATTDVAAALIAAGHRALVVSSGGPMVELLVQRGARHFQCDVASKNPWIVWTNRRRLIDIANAENVDIIHARSRAPAWSALWAARALKLPFVTTFHDAYRGVSVAKKFYNGVMARGDRVIAISRFVAEHVRTQYPAARDRIVTIPRGVDLSEFDPARITPERIKRFRAGHGVPPDVSLLIMPARLSQTKGHELTLHALARLDGRAFFCLMIGPAKGHAAYRDRLLALTHELALQDKVRFAERADLPAAYAAADLVLSASQKGEGFGRVPVEAQAMGTPVVATGLGATLETVIDGETGWLIPAGDARVLADTIIRALAIAPDQRRRMAERAVGHARANFDVKQMCAATLDLYAGLLVASATTRQYCEPARDRLEVS